MLKREVKVPNSRSLFIFGPRQVGKTTLIRKSFDPDSIFEYNLLQGEVYTKFKAHPELIREEVAALPKHITHVSIDEAQRVPQLLDEVQYLLDSGTDKKFIISGSSARKLKRGQANLLGGRALSINLFPLTYAELPTGFSLQKILSYGTLPPNVIISDEEMIQEQLRSYVEVYLKEEIELEALSRNLGGFIRFLSVAGQSNGEQLNYSNVASDVGMSSVTVKEYYKILEDTLLGSFLLPFEFSERKKHKTSPKFYFFDTGVLRAIQKRLTLPVTPGNFEFGNYFESWIINEVIRINSYLRKDLTLSFLRTQNNVEVDLIIQTPAGRTLAIEIKSKQIPIKQDFESGFLAIRRITPKAECYCVCTGETARIVGDVKVLSYQEFFTLVREL